jgi:hypothetical protein
MSLKKKQKFNYKEKDYEKAIDVILCGVCVDGVDGS